MLEQLVALGMDRRAFRTDELPPGIEADDDEPAPLGPSVADCWQIILSWQDNTKSQ